MVRDGDLAQIERILAVVVDERQTLAYAYLERLFTVRPEMRWYFGQDLSVHATRFMEVITSGPLAVEVPGEMAAAMRAMGAEHAGWGLREEHYDDIVAAVLWTLERRAGPEWDAAAAETWGRLLVWVAGQLAAGLREETARMAVDKAG